MRKGPGARKKKPTRAQVEAQEIEDLELRLTELDPAAALADDSRGQDGKRESFPSGKNALSFSARILRCSHFPIPLIWWVSKRFGASYGLLRWGTAAERLWNFEDLPLSRCTKEGLKSAKYTRMTAIQRAALPHTLTGKDVLGAAKTGSGKTLAFVIPVRMLPYSAVGSSSRTPVLQLLLCRVQKQEAFWMRP